MDNYKKVVTITMVIEAEMNGEATKCNITASMKGECTPALVPGIISAIERATDKITTDLIKQGAECIIDGIAEARGKGASK